MAGLKHESHSPKCGAGSRIVSAVKDLRYWRKEAPTNCGPLTIKRGSSVADLKPRTEQLSTKLNVSIAVTRVTQRKQTMRLLRLDEVAGVLSWDSKTTSKLYLDHICEIHTEDMARNYRQEFGIPETLKNRWVTIIYQRPDESRLRALHLLTETHQDFKMLVCCIGNLLTIRQEMMKGITRADQAFVKMHWKSHNRTSDSIDFEQFERLAKSLHINCTSRQLRQMFTEADADHNEKLSFTEFKTLVEILKRRPEIDDIFREYALEKMMSLEEFTHFVVTAQKQEMTHSLRAAFVAAADEDGKISAEQFRDLLSKQFSPVRKQEPQLLNPLSDYFISSSHNTYLTQKQFGSGSTIEGYVRVLQEGCRCIEIDIWSGQHGPVVCHGSALKKLTASILFKDVIHAIVKVGFLSSPYPLILSLEINCGPPVQKQIVQILKDELGDSLVQRLEADYMGGMPSPEQLKHKVLIKVKRNKPTSSGASVSGDDQSGSTDASDESTMSNASSRSISSRISFKRTRIIIPELSSLGVYLSGRKYDSGELVRNKKEFTCYSFSEPKLDKLRCSPVFQSEIEQHNWHKLSRVYPSGMRMNSSNFDPITYWKLGFQLVALNWQTGDQSMRLNRAMFADRLGYTLKPAHLRNQQGDFNIQRQFSLDIISAQQLPRPKKLGETESIKPQVQVQVLGLNHKTEFTTPATDDGFKPIWNSHFEFKVSESQAQLAFLSFDIRSGQTVVANFTCRLSALQHGYRHLLLQNAQGEEYTFASLFIRVSYN